MCAETLGGQNQWRQQVIRTVSLVILGPERLDPCAVPPAENPTTPLIATSVSLSRLVRQKNFPSAAIPQTSPAGVHHHHFFPPYAPTPTTAMAPSKTKTVKNKFAGPKRENDGVVKKKAGGKPTAKQVHASSLKPQLDKKKKKKTYTEEELGIPKLNAIRPVEVVKPKGQKKGKVFVDDPVRSLWRSCFSSFYAPLHSVGGE